MERFIKFTKIYLECTLEYVGGVQIANALVLTHFGGKDKNVYITRDNTSTIRRQDGTVL